MSTIRFDTRFPGYEVLSELGRSNARILKARHLATGDLVAIKHFALNTDAETLRRFERESAIMSSIAHPNIVKVREVRLEAELPYLVMELIEGGSLDQLIASRGSLDTSTASRLGLQMASAFKAIHPQGIVHRDIKPENILYRPLPSGELHFLLTDFGVARLHEQSNTLTGQSLMTYEYASPEQFNDPRSVGAATDYYSLGVVLYECLHGSVPFALDDHTGIVTFMNKVLTEAPPALTISSNDQTLSPFADLLRGLLQKKAADRLSDPDELTWLLKQAELTWLQANRTHQVRTSAEPIKSATLREPEKNKDTSANVAPLEARPIQNPRSRNPMSGSLKWAALAIAIFLGIVGLYLTVLKPRSGTRTTLVDTPITHTDSTEVSDRSEETERQQREAEEAVRREQLRQEAQAAADGLTVKANDYRVGFFGGIKNVQLQLSNPSQVTFSSVVVKVNYYKDNGGLYKSEKVSFNNVGPNSSAIQSAPNSDRGTKLTYKIVEHRFAPPLDSLMQTASSDSIH
ncbi:MULTISPECIES: serine/threonine-protein kinase [unclassified Spirosoma]|uniref:serine/threonine protein kinase n=1 Tax=unclassified Spirosoma TaxID=2621999 RepID=UPI000965593F|nr:MULTISPECIES: serine/threonine-protein kinase [unclassified Spirosoma]MBN8825853.1 serine/threonine protein kinase [Spirosoma sp.]OJW70549.1 MAG: serine/threonine protein kinase [Spirosoma sp. 48-14]